MKTILAHVYYLKEDEVEHKNMRLYPPLGLLYISAYLEKMKLDHLVYDGTFNSADEFRLFILKNRPGIIGLYANFLVRRNILDIIHFVRSTDDLKETKIIIGGPDARFHTTDYLDKGVDYVISGEGEITFYELVSALRKNQSPNKILGLTFYEKNKKLRFTGERPHIENIDKLPFPARNKIDLSKYLESWKSNHGYSSITVNTQRGCPYSCRWCSHAVFGDTYRRRSPEDVVGELEYLIRKYNPDSFWFVDDVFTMNRRWINEFSKILDQKGIKISFECISRSDKLDEDIIKTLKKSGCKLIWIGAESGSQNVLDLMDRRVVIEDVQTMISLAKENRIETGTFIMLGYPGETVADIQLSIDHLILCDPDYFTINLAYPIKGTKFYDQVKDRILNFNWSDTPDKDLEFKRIYSKLFYQLALRKVYNKVHAAKSRKQKEYRNFLKYSIKGNIAGILMKLLT